MKLPAWMQQSLTNETSTFGSGNGMVPSGNKPLADPKLSQICHHMVPLNHNELTD